jgi:GntR family transcriptional regulator
MPGEIDRWSETPYYEQLAALVVAQIAGGELGPGQPLPSERHLMDTYGLSRATTRRALEVLAERGWIVTHRRRGSRVTPREDWPEG